ncbi:hypothetical protein KUL25_18745 [Rhodobacteraceae bacterium N5(2021)]|uniref:Uncharacterized protein n=1 Tax=Gymnodinialimonas phycosphaerae TaxID=2841589 RepID=A0A975YFI6_9RHOB|nr:hypothetical protein [Gymnodinialimonas phycosphaerae]MBY4894800.1 hypothetical protein [Gymnodinialimonas phycosphaerae]
MATLSTNTTQISARPLLAALARLAQNLKPTPKTAQQLLAAQSRHEAARARVDHLLR